MQLKTTLRALAVGVESRHQHCTAIRTSRSRDRADHSRSARAEVVGGSTGTSLRRLALWSFSFLMFFRVTIAAVTVLAIHKRLRPSVSTDCQLRGLLTQLQRGSLRVFYPIGLLQSLGSQPSPMKCSWIPESESRRWDSYVCNPLGVRSQARL